MRFTFYFRQIGSHVRVRLFTNGALLGTLVMTPEEWAAFRLLLEAEGRFGRPVGQPDGEIDSAGNVSGLE